MRLEEWQRVENLFHGTLELSRTERAEYLSRECGENESLRLEVESLISAFEVESSFIDEPAVSLGIKVLYDGLSGSLAGRSIGQYQIIRLLGEGGMGEVYLAQDTVLERQVALKFISGAMLDNEWAREQLRREAIAVARLENFHICAVYDFEKIDGYDFIVMQYVEGETLSSVLRQGRLDSERALEWAEQLTNVLSAAHGRGIIHRDIKPQNIMVTSEGQLKVLDFGLAKFTRPRLDQEGEGPNTSVGVIAGTAAYMSPEQRRGESLDGRGDIYSLGIVICEMFGWANPSQCETDEAMIAALRATGGVKQNKLRAGLERIVIKCLYRDRELRYASAEELRTDIRELRAALAPGPRSFWDRLGWAHYAVAAVVLGLVLLAGGLLYRQMVRTQTLAVLHIDSSKLDSDQKYLGDGLTRGLADKFSYLRRLKVRIPSRKPGTDEKVDPLKVARDLQMESALTGELIRQGDTLKLHLRLLDTASGSQTWEGTFDVNKDDLLIVQDEVAKDVTAQLGMWFIGEDLAKRATNNREAFDYYIRGRDLWSLKRNKKNIQEAIKLFERAKDLDPTFARAFAGLADCYALTTGTLYGPNKTKEAMEKAAWNANKAIELDSTLPEAHTSQGLVALNNWDWQASERAFKKAIELNPEYAPARFWYSNLLASQKRFDEAIQQGELAKSYDPYSRLADMNYGRTLYYTGRYAEAVTHFARLVEQEPNYPQFLHAMGLVLAQQGRYDDAISMLKKVHEKNPLHAAAALGYVYGKAGKKEDALAVLQELEELGKTEVVPPFEKALVYIGLGDFDNAFSQLEASYLERVTGLAYLTTDPVFNSLRGDPRFSDLARRLNLLT